MLKAARNLRAAVLTAVLASAAVASVAQATRWVSPFLGRGGNGQHALSCMEGQVFNGEVFSQCDGQQLFYVPLIWENTGNKSITFMMNATQTADNCAAITINRNGTGFASSAEARPGTLNSYVSVTTGSVNVQSNNQFLAQCTLSPGTGVSTFRYAQ
jgi:hypothetical protein